MYDHLKGLTDLSNGKEISLMIFLAVFIGTTLWIMTRSKADVRHWADLPLEGEDAAGEFSDLNPKN